MTVWNNNSKEYVLYISSIYRVSHKICLLQITWNKSKIFINRNCQREYMVILKDFDLSIPLPLPPKNEFSTEKTLSFIYSKSDNLEFKIIGKIMQF